MKINKIFHIILIIIVTALIVAGVMYLYHYSEKKGEQKSHDKQIAGKDTTIANFKVRIARLEDEIAAKPDRLPDDLLKIYTVDAIADVEGVDFCLAVPGYCTVIEKLKMISNLLMNYKFKRGIITLKTIEQRNGNSIAIIELKETKKDTMAWKGGYFQGSCGGHSTTYILVNTFLQPDYTGKWIDGVEFWYDGKPVANDWDHIFLHGTMYRKGAGR
ncbi:MAG: hypothetical protein WBB67_01665 [bacterium]